MKLRLASPSVLIDINRITALEEVLNSGADGCTIGALVRHHRLEKLSWTAPLASIGDAARHIGDPQIRNTGTIGGSLAEVDPAGDWGPVMLSLAAKIKARSARGERVISVDEFFIEAYTSALKEDELLCEVAIPAATGRVGAAYVKMERKAGDFAIASVAARVSLSPENECESVRIGMGGVGLLPLRARHAEDILRGKPLAESALGEAQRLVEKECEPFADIRGTVDYKRHLAGVLFRKAFQIAVKRAQGEKVETLHV
jgi:carbon-monoxide dehydrogenase medium subunit